MMIELDFSYLNKIPFEYGLRYEEVLEGVSSVIFAYTNFTQQRTYKNNANIFIQIANRHLDETSSVLPLIRNTTRYTREDEKVFPNFVDNDYIREGVLPYNIFIRPVRESGIIESDIKTVIRNQEKLTNAIDTYCSVYDRMHGLVYTDEEDYNNLRTYGNRTASPNEYTKNFTRALSTSQAVLNELTNLTSNEQILEYRYSRFIPTSVKMEGYTNIMEDFVNLFQQRPMVNLYQSESFSFDIVKDSVLIGNPLFLGNNKEMNSNCEQRFVIDHIRYLTQFRTSDFFDKMKTAISKLVQSFGDRIINTDSSILQITEMYRPRLELDQGGTFTNIADSSMNKMADINIYFAPVTPSTNMDVKVHDLVGVQYGQSELGQMMMVAVYGGKDKGATKGDSIEGEKFGPNIDVYDSFLVRKTEFSNETTVIDLLSFSYSENQLFIPGTFDEFEKIKSNNTSIVEAVEFWKGNTGLGVNNGDAIFETYNRELSVNDIESVETFKSRDTDVNTLYSYDVGVKNIYHNIFKHGIIDVDKTPIGLVPHRRLINYIRFLKIAKPFQKILDSVMVDEAFRHLYVDPEESVQSIHVPYNVNYDTYPNWLQTPEGKFKGRVIVNKFLPIEKPMDTNINDDNLVEVFRDKFKSTKIDLRQVFFTVKTKDARHKITFTGIDTSKRDMSAKHKIVFSSADNKDVNSVITDKFSSRDLKDSRGFDVGSFAINDKRDTGHKESTMALDSIARNIGTIISSVGYHHAPRPTRHKEYSKYFIRNAYDTSVQSKEALGKMLSKAGYLTGIAKSILHYSKAPRATSNYKTWKFMFNKTYEINKIKKTVIYDTYWCYKFVGEADVRDDSLVFTMETKTAIIEDRATYLQYNTVDIKPRDTDSWIPLFIYKAYSVDALIENSAFFLQKSERQRNIYFESHNTNIDVVRLIEQFNQMQPVSRAELTGSYIPEGVDVARVETPFGGLPNSKETAMFLISKDKVDTFIPHYELIHRDETARGIVMDDSIAVRIDSPYNDFFDSFAGRGVDELILPHDDFDYSTFKEGLVNEVTGRPIKMVSAIDSKTFIAKRPVNHPLPEFKDISKEYIDVDAHLLKYMIETLYIIWQKSIFKFGGMDMRDAVAKMLEYMDVFVTYRIPEQLQDQARRVIRLIRWYGEYAILSQAEYRIHLQFSDLKSNMHKGMLDIPHTMEGLEIDLTKYVLRNTNLGSDAHIEMELTNIADTTISFMTIISGGELEVSVNGEVVDVIKISKRLCEYEIPASENGVPNKVLLSYKDSNNGVVNIANIIVKEYLYTDIVTEYSPKVGTGNIAINNLINKLTAYQYTMDENSELIQEAVKGNLALHELVDKLIKYFNLHHANKDKGKRLTMKK